MSDKIFIGRVDSKMMPSNSGEWEKTTISLGPQDFEKLQQYRNAKGWVNLLLKESAQGKKYIELDQYVPTRPSGLENTQQLPPTPDEAAMPWDDSNF